MKPDHIRVVAGSQFRYDLDQVAYQEILQEIIIHENFSRSSLEGNLAVGILSVPLPDNNLRLGFIDIEDIAFHPPVMGTKCKIYGWSLTTRGDVSPHLLSGDVKIESISACDTSVNKISSTSICAGPYHVNGCETDDGAPLICNGKVIGLIDYRPAGYCSRIITNRLGTYVDLSAYHEWIAEFSGASKMSQGIMIICLLIIKIINF
jgi:secreted trypsin-like serine protease